MYNFIQDLKLDKFIIFAHSLGGPIALELADICRESIETIIFSEANLDKSSEGAFSYKFGICKEEDFVNSVFDEAVNENSIDNSMWAATLSVCSSTAISRISKSAGHSMAWENLKGLAEAI